MTPEEKSLLERTYRVAKENNEILISMRRTGRIGLAMRIVYWLAIIGVGYGAYYFIQPYLEMMLDLYSQGSSMVNSSMDAVGSLKELLK